MISETLLSNEAIKSEEKKQEPSNADEVPITVDNSMCEETHQLENSKTILDEQNESLNKLLNNVNYGIILAFFDKFAVHLGLKDIVVFKNFETSIINKKTCKKSTLSKYFLLMYLSIINY